MVSIENIDETKEGNNTKSDPICYIITKN